MLHASSSTGSPRHNTHQHCFVTNRAPSSLSPKEGTHDGDMTMPTIPKHYVPLSGSERSPARGARLLRAAHEEDTFKVTIVLRRRTDGAAVPDFSYYLKTPPSRRRRLPHSEFVKKYGAHPGDLAKVEAFAKTNGLTIVGANAARRTV